MLCLRCIHSRDDIPEKVEVEGKDIAEQLRTLWKRIAGRGYPVRIYCDERKEVKVGDPASPAKSVTECKHFTAA